ncbi:hypothetical protein EVAR_20753_1 [Eumeta japonica]|uniref:Uncharacterized protein n=1 Tax=Eumeta variegata TaxID=151549 RepID=A0A4C1V9X2_EUMVA|nr:hypothetical protein EVAR_20753_1 [Eumeta japonica]
MLDLLFPRRIERKSGSYRAPSPSLASTAGRRPLTGYLPRTVLSHPRPTGVLHLDQIVRPSNERPFHAATSDSGHHSKAFSSRP